MTSAASSISSTCTFPAFPTQTSVSTLGPVAPIQNNGTIQSLLIGAWNPNHTSTATITYNNITMPTPWPILLTGYFVSLGTALYGGISSSRSERAHRLGILKPPSWAEMVFSSSLAGYQAVRAFLALVAAFQAMTGAGGRFMSSSAIVALMLSNVTTVMNIDTLNVFRAFAALGTLSSFIVIIIMSLSGVLWHEYYGKWLLTGGNCPKVVGGLSSFVHASCSQLYFVGCGVDTLAQANYNNATLRSGYLSAVDANNVAPKNIIVIGEKVLGWFVVGVVGFLLVFSLPEILVWFFGGLVALRRILGNLFSLDRHYKWLERKTVASWLALVIIVIVTSVGFPLHYVTETRNVSLVVQDNFGNISSSLVNYTTGALDAGQPLWQTFTGDGIDGYSWTDFFVVHPPHDRYGFLHYWWNTENARAWHSLSLA